MPIHSRGSRQPGGAGAYGGRAGRGSRVRTSRAHHGPNARNRAVPRPQGLSTGPSVVDPRHFGAGVTMGCMDPKDPMPRFLTLADVAEVLNTSSAQVYALVRRGDLPAIKIGGRGQWRVESSQLEDYIERMYHETKAFVSQHPYVEAEAATDAE